MQTAALADSPVASAFSTTLVDSRLQHEVEQFLYREARLLDEHRYMDWFGLLAEDIRYYMPIRTTRNAREANKEISTEPSFAHFDEDYSMMRSRMIKVTSEFGWAENPASRTRHLVANVIIDEVSANELIVRSAFILYRNRLERQVDIFAGERVDVLRRVADERGFQIAKRTIMLDQSTLLANNLSVFF